MKSIRGVFVGVSAALILVGLTGRGMSLKAQEKHDHEHKAEQKVDQEMSSKDDMMKKCHEHRAQMPKSMDEMMAMMEKAEMSGDKAMMRAALKDSREKMSSMKSRMSECMNQMQAMDGMHGSKAMHQCPMHPNHKSDKPGRCPKCGMNMEKMK